MKLFNETLMCYMRNLWFDCFQTVHCKHQLLHNFYLNIYIYIRKIKYDR
jgi:hypothetical protein